VLVVVYEQHGQHRGSADQTGV